MYKKCEVCGSDNRVYQKRYIDGNDVWVCDDCKTKFDHDEIEKRLGSVEKACDFKDWKSSDMSEAFWIHLGKYQKHPNRYSLTIMLRAFTWACHADHGLSNSFSNAMKWCGIDWVKEKNRKDLPEV